MHTRLLEIVKYKTGGKQTQFASLLGWTPQYLAKLLRGESFGFNPVISLVTALPEINARWFLTGEGDMLLYDIPAEIKHTKIRKAMYENAMNVFSLEKYMPVMSPEELKEFEKVVSGKKKADFSPDTLEKWARLLIERESEINAKYKAAGRKFKK